MSVIKQLFEEWPKYLLRPVLVSVITAAALFALAALFKPMLYWIFTPPKDLRYPLICFFEPYNNAGELKKYYIDIYIVNPTSLDYSWQQLKNTLMTISGSSNRDLSPNLTLKLNRELSPGKIESAVNAANFNRGKGDIKVQLLSGHTVQIKILSIKKRSFMKATLTISNDPRVNRKTVVSRDAHGTWVPFDFETLQDRCYQTQ